MKGQKFDKMMQSLDNQPEPISRDAHKIVLYSSPTCPYCKLVKDYLDNLKFKFEEIDVSADPDKANDLVRKSGQTAVPVLDIDGHIIVGFNRLMIDRLLNVD